MRELKFRAWDKKQKKMLYGVSIGTIKIWDENAPLISNEFSYSEDCVFEQYTGLKDKNGKEIYEGDIVRNTVEVAPNKSSTYKIYYDQSHAMYGMLPVDGKIDIGDFYGYKMRHQFEVIGNIHENLDLLGEEAE